MIMYVYTAKNNIIGNLFVHDDSFLFQILNGLLPSCTVSPSHTFLHQTCMYVYIQALMVPPMYTHHRPSAGRQLLTDYRHLIVWLTSNSQSLSKEASHTISSLPLINELEHGLLVVCGTAGVSQEGGVALSSLLHCTHLPLLKEMAWLNKEDWTKALAV